MTRRTDLAHDGDPDYLARSCELKSGAAYHEAMLTEEPAMAEMLLAASESFGRTARRARGGG